MRTIDLDALQIFRAVVTEGGVTQAALRLNRVPSNVTTRVQQLEERLETKLFQRQGRKLVLTAEGKLLLGYAQRLLDLSAEARQALRSGEPRGVLRLGTLESTAASRLPPILSRFHAACPDVQMELVTGTSGALVDRVLNYEIEAAFVAEPFAATNLHCEHAFTEVLALIAPTSAGTIRSPGDLGTRTVIAFPQGCSYRRILENWLGRRRAAPARIMEFASYHAILACVAAGAGVAVVPRSVIEVLRAASQVRAFALPARFAEARTMLICRRGHHSPALDALRREVGVQFSSGLETCSAVNLQQAKGRRKTAGFPSQRNSKEPA